MDRKRTPLDREEVQRLEAVLRADHRVAEAIFLTVHDRGEPVTYVILEAHPGYRGQLLGVEYLHRANLMTSTGARCGIYVTPRLLRTPSGEVDRATLTAELERSLVDD